MSDVSCRVLEMLFVELRRKELKPSVLLRGVDCTEKQVQNKHERIRWSSFLRLMENVQEIWTDDEIVAMGGAWIDTPMFRSIRSVAGILFTPKQFYRWIASDSEGSAGKQMISCVRTTFHDLGPDHLALDVRVDEGFAPCPAFFLLNKGGFRDIPRLAGKPRADVTTTPIDRGLRYEVRLAPGSDRVSRIHRAVRWVTAPKTIVAELNDAQVTLQARYEELDRARAKVATQAAQLRTAHTVNELIQKNLDLDLTLGAIAGALVTEAGFVRVQVALDAEVDGMKVVRSIERGDGGGTRFERVLEGRGGHRTGTLTLFASASADPTERDELLAFIVPSVAMALDDAISYLVVQDYRRSLEVRVAERTAELTEAKEVRDRIFANVNHDLRSPLSLILLAVAEARRSGGSADERTLGSIEHGARRVLRMVDELLLLAEGREREARLATALCDLGATATAVAQAWRPAAEAAGLVLDHEAALGTVVRADPNALERILANLVSNALKFTPKGGHIRVVVRADDDRAILEVSDDGPGIDPELKARLFGRFERGNRSSAIGGSGLGLSLVKELAEAHGGSVTVDDAAGGGAVFRVELPRVRAAADTDRGAALRPSDYGAATEVELPSVYEPIGTPRATILLAEDDPQLRDYTARLLSDTYRVLAAPDGRAALALAKMHAPDLLITDIAMPEMDGIELTKQFRALTNNRMAPVLVLTTFGALGDKLAGFDAGAIDHIHKPFEPEELRARVRSQLVVRTLALQLLESEKLAALGTLSAGLAHEIRNPANGIINAVGPLREVLPPGALEPGTPAAQLLDIVEACSKQVASLARELLGFKRGVELKRQSVPLETLIRRVKTTVQHTLEGVEVRERLDYRGDFLCAVPLVTQVLTNLLENGAHAAGRGGWVEIHSVLDGPRLVLELTDSGPGVPEELRERIFEPFFTTKPAGAGTGLGLSTARDIALRHGGILDVRRASGRTVFHLELPLEP